MCLTRELQRATTAANQRKAKLSKQRLARQVTARLNLNKVWAELEELYVGRTSSSALPAWTETKEELENNINENIELEQRRQQAGEDTPLRFQPGRP